MSPTIAASPAAWTVEELAADRGWIFTLDEAEARGLIGAVRAARREGRPLLDYRREEFDLGSAWRVIAAALHETKQGRGLALVRGLPRAGVTAEEFELMTWAIGLHAGVARPQGRLSQYISAVRNVGTDYRSATGRGYSSDAELDFHTDGADLVALSCYNQGIAGGVSIVTSAVAAHRALAAERPDLSELLWQPYYFSRQGEMAPDEPPYYPNPIAAIEDGRFYSKWNRNRLRTAQALPGVPKLTEAQIEATEALDAALRRPELMFTTMLQPGDLQLMDNHTMLHSRTSFTDGEAPDQKRCLFRLWLAPPDSPRLPTGWQPFFRSIAPGSVRGGIRGHHHDAGCLAYETRQAAALGMTMAY